MVIKTYKNALIFDRNHRDSLLSLANILMRLHQYDRAVKYLKHANQIFKDDIEILYGYSLSIFRDYVTFKDRVMSHNPTSKVSGLLTD
jgi:tetratricopeptide (TPR) repeat protein